MPEYRDRVIFNTVRDALREFVVDRDAHGAVLDDLADVLAPEGWATGDFALPPGWYVDYATSIHSHPETEAPT